MKPYTIIIADDHSIFRDGLVSLTEKEQDFQIVGQAGDGAELLECLKAKPLPDIVVTDLSMPHMDGMSAIKKIKKKFPKVRILVLTMLKDHEHFRHAMAAGASGYLLKDDAFDQFALACRCVMRGKNYISPSAATQAVERFLRSSDETEDPAFDILTPREKQILKHIARGLANKNIAAKLKISIRTVETHRANLTDKLGIKNTAGLVKFALSKGLD